MSDVFDTTKTVGDETALAGLVGEGKKFSTTEDLAKGKLDSDTFIKKLEAENAEALDALKVAQESAKDGATVSELLKAMQDSQNKNPDDGKPVLSEEDLRKLVRDTVSGDSAEATAAANRAEGNKLVLDKVGGDAEAAKTYLADRAAALNLTVEKLAALSESSPQAFAELVGLARTKDSSPGKSIVSLKTAGDGDGVTSSAVMEVEGHKTKAHYDALKKEMGVAKFLGNHKLQNAYLKDAMALTEEQFNPTNV